MNHLAVSGCCQAWLLLTKVKPTEALRGEAHRQREARVNAALSSLLDSNTTGSEDTKETVDMTLLTAAEILYFILFQLNFLILLNLLSPL